MISVYKMRHSHVILWLTLSLVMAQVDDMPFCSMRYERLCQGKGGPHVGCQFPYSGAGEACQNYTAILFTDDLKRFILHYVNRRRQRIAAGHERVRGGAHLPKPEVMMQVLWDRELAFLAQRLADQCRFVHDDCRATVRYPFAGQTVGEVRWRRAGESMEMEAKRSIGRVFDAWWGERRRVLVRQMILPFRLTPRGAVWGHFSQLAVWKLRALGCGAVHHGSSRPRLLLVCDFSHTNMLGQKTISPGPLAQCPMHTKRISTSPYPLLCAPVRPSLLKEVHYSEDQRDEEEDSEENLDTSTQPPDMSPYRPFRPAHEDFNLETVQTRRVETTSTRKRRPIDVLYRDTDYKLNQGLSETNRDLQVRLKAAQKYPEDPSRRMLMQSKGVYKSMQHRGRERETTRRLYQLWREEHEVEHDDEESIEVIPLRKDINMMRHEITTLEIYRPTAYPSNEQFAKQRWKRPRDRPRRPGANSLLNTPKDLTIRKSASWMMDQEDADQLFRDTGFKPTKTQAL